MPGGGFSGTDIEIWKVVGTHLGLDIEFVEVGNIPRMISEVWLGDLAWRRKHYY